jgi:hypothetical protein
MEVPLQRYIRYILPHGDPGPDTADDSINSPRSGAYAGIRLKPTIERIHLYKRVGLTNLMGKLAICKLQVLARGATGRRETETFPYEPPNYVAISEQFLGGIQDALERLQPNLEELAGSQHPAVQDSWRFLAHLRLNGWILTPQEAGAERNNLKTAEDCWIGGNDGQVVRDSDTLAALKPCWRDRTAAGRLLRSVSG